MATRRVGLDGPEVSRLVLGTMTFGSRASSRDQLADHLAAGMSPALDDEDVLERCDELWYGSLRGAAPRYDR